MLAFVCHTGETGGDAMSCAGRCQPRARRAASKNANSNRIARR